MSNRRVAYCLDAIGEAIHSVNIAIDDLERAKRQLSAGVDGAGPVWTRLNTAGKVLAGQAAELAIALDAASGLLEGDRK